MPVHLLRPKPTPYDPLAWREKPFLERGRMVCAAWALQGYGAPALALVFYALKVLFYIWAWSAFCSTTPGLGGPCLVFKPVFNTARSPVPRRRP